MNTEYRNIIDGFKPGFVFTFQDFNVSRENAKALSQYLYRLVKNGKIKKLSPGKFYKPEESIFGELKPEISEVVKDLLEKNGEIIGYLTGYSIFNKLNLTTQVSNTIVIGTNEEKKMIKRGFYTIRFIKQKNSIKKSNTKLLQILDCIRLIKTIPDTNVNNSCNIFKDIIKGLESNELKELIKCAVNYNPSTIALTGAIIEEVNNEINTESLYMLLNPITKYKFNISNKVLICQGKWNLI